MVQFLFSGDETIIPSDNVVELLIISELFYCETLKLACQRHIQEGIELETNSALLEVANRFLIFSRHL